MKANFVLAYLAGICAFTSQIANAIELDLTSTDSIKSAASTIAWGMMHYYTGNRTGDVPGNLPDPYYWWEAGAMFGAMIDYWYYTNDTTYNDEVQQAMLWQVGADDNYMPANQSKSLGNDDQGFWGIAAMSAVESNFQNPPSDQPQWLALAQAVFNTQASRWDVETCGGGLRWQILSLNAGYGYKNSVANGVFFNIASRLALYTGNSSYSDWAEKTWDWMEEIGLIGDEYQIYDGTSVTDNCSSIDHIQWTYNAGLFLLGAANLYQSTNDEIWKTRTNGLLNSTSIFFNDDGVMFEVACELSNNCDVDQLSFKAYLARWMAATAIAAPWTYDTIMPLIRTSAAAAALQCSGTGGTGAGANDVCGFRWIDGATWDGSNGVGQQMSALEVIQGNLIQQAPKLVTNSTGGTSPGNAGAGGNSATTAADVAAGRKVTTGDRVGAGIVTVILLLMLLVGAWFMVF